MWEVAPKVLLPSTCYCGCRRVGKHERQRVEAWARSVNVDRCDPVWCQSAERP